MSERRAVPRSVVEAVLIEAGYRCAVPTCRNILAIDLHHLEEVAEGGGNEPGNLLSLCPTCHALYHRGTISRDALFAWKGMVIALGHAFDRDAIDMLLFLAQPATQSLRVDGNGVLRFARLVSSDLARFDLTMQNGPLLLYKIALSPKGTALVDAWKKGDRNAVGKALAGT